MNAKVGDMLFYKRSGQWSFGWEVTQVFTNQHNTVFEVMVGRKDKTRRLPLYSNRPSDAVYVIPPKEEIEKYLEDIQDYPNLVIIRRFNAEPAAYMLFCLNCQSVLGFTQVYTEESEIVLWNGMLTQSKPMIADGYEKVTCACKAKEYTFSNIEPY